MHSFYLFDTDSSIKLISTDVTVVVGTWLIVLDVI